MTFRGWHTTPEGIKVRHWQITPGPDPLTPRPHVLYFNSDGDVTIEDEMGVSVTYSVTKGTFFPFSPVKITAATATVIGLL